MRKLQGIPPHPKQVELLGQLAAIGLDGHNTHNIAMLLGHRQGYEQHLKDRLFRLAKRGFLTYTTEYGKNGGVFQRRWYFVFTKKGDENVTRG